MLDLVRKIIKKEKVRYGKPKPILVSLLHCLYEAQDPSLCHFVAEQLECRLDLRCTSLTPVDCLAIGYFISCVTVSIMSNSVNKFVVSLRNCSLGDTGTKSLMQSVCSSVDGHSTVNTNLIINIIANEIHEEGTSHIAEVLNRTNIVSTLWLDQNPIGDKGLLTIFDALKRNNTLKRLDVVSCEMTDTGVASLADVLSTNNTLETLYIYGNDTLTGNGLTSLVEVLTRNSGLVKLVLPRHLEPCVDEVKRIINEARKRSGLAAIEVWGKYVLLKCMN